MHRFVRSRAAATLAICLLTMAAAQAQEAAHPLSGVPLRNIGPAISSGRVSDFAFHPDDHETYYVAMASGNVWKTTNDGITWTPVFEHEGSYAIGTIVLDPADPDTVWLGTGENNAQRSVAFGDGVYRSRDGGKSWQNMGLRDSGHIGQIRVHPEDSDVVWVAAQGPLWNAGGDRGLYRTTDGGESWEPMLTVDEHTGANEFVWHADNPDVIVASTWQRRRHVWTLINGGPGSGVHKSTDGGETWREITAGLPGGDKGRIGLAAAPSAPDVIYAIVEADEDGQGVYRSDDFGESWTKQSSWMSTSPQYYNELVVDPNDPDRVYALNTFTSVSADAGKSFERMTIEYRHVDDHALWVDPADSHHLVIGGDGGVYESFDRGSTWRHVRNLPTSQFYRATPDNDTPFYNVCAGTQDNHTQCGPSRTTFTDGITNADWWISKFGDGFKTRFDPTNPDIVYSQAQYGNLMRFDKVTGEKVLITPIPASGETNYKWNWNSPLIVSPHDSNRLYYGAERLFRSDDRGDSWTEVSGDLSRGLDRNQLEVMGRVWSVDAIAKNDSTSFYGSLIALDESPLEEGLLYVGTDDGLVQVSEDGGDNWRRVASFPGVPDQALIEDIVASLHDADVAYMVVDNHKRGDHAPYVLRSADRGRSWSPITGDLPDRGTAHSIVEDHVDPNLLFVGTEFGVFFTQDGGNSWHELRNLPTISVRDLEIQRRDDDLVIGTFGRGVWILDDIGPLRTPLADLEDGPTLFAVPDTWLYLPDARRGWGGLGDYGHGKYAADNPPYGAVIAYYLPEAIRTLREERREREKEIAEEGGDNPYPSWDQLRREDREEAPTVVLTIRDAGGKVVRRLTGPTGKGFHRVAWDLRYPAPDPIRLDATPNWAPWMSDPQGPLVVPGEYSVELARRVRGDLQPLGMGQKFTVRRLHDGGLVSADPEAVLAFQQQTAELARAINGANAAAGEAAERIDHLVAAARQTPRADESLAERVRELDARMDDLQVALNGDTTRARRNEPTPLSLTGRIGWIAYGHWDSQADVPDQYRDSLATAEAEFEEVLADLEGIVADVEALEADLEDAGAPWTPGRLPEWE